MKGKRKCYNSGKISGLPYLVAYNNFKSADKEIAARGFESVNPMEEKWLRPSAPWIFHMIVDIWHLLWCSTVYFQKNWSESRGAQIEFYIALNLNKEIIMQK